MQDILVGHTAGHFWHVRDGLRRLRLQQGIRLVRLSIPLRTLFAGFFLYIGASDLVPESHHRHPTLWTTAMTVLGAAVLFIAIRAAGV